MRASLVIVRNEMLTNAMGTGCVHRHRVLNLAPQLEVLFTTCCSFCPATQHLDFDFGGEVVRRLS